MQSPRPSVYRRPGLFTWTLGLVLVLLGTSMMTVRARWRSSRAEAIDGDETYWRLGYDIRYTPVEPAASCQVRLPESRGALHITREAFVHRGVEPEIIRDAKSGGRVLWTRSGREPGPLRLTLHFDIRIASDGSTSAEPPGAPSDPAGHPLFAGEDWSVPDDPAVLRAVAEALGGSNAAGSLVECEGVENEKLRFSIKPILPSSRERSGEWPILTILDLSRLPPSLTDTIALVLLLPLGGLIIAACKRFLGIRSFGYFTAALLAISFVGVPWQTGLTVFGVIGAIGVAGRLAIQGLRLGKIPRLSLLLLLVVISLTFTVSVLEYLDMNPGSRGVLLPLICLTILFERFHISINKKGLSAGLRRLSGTLLVTGACLYLFRMQSLQTLVVMYPEVEFLVAAGLVLVGRVNPEGLDAPEKDPDQEASNEVLE